MGNCFTKNKILTQNDQDESQNCCNEANEVIKVDGVKIKNNKNNMKKKKKKAVRFKLNEENSVDERSGNQGDSKNGVARIRLVVTQEELKQILLGSRKGLKQSSMEQLIRVVKLRGVRVSEDGRTSDDDDDGFHGAWRPALESIPEER